MRRLGFVFLLGMVGLLSACARQQGQPDSTSEQPAAAEPQAAEDADQESRIDASRTETDPKAGPQSEPLQADPPGTEPPVVAPEPMPMSDMAGGWNHAEVDDPDVVAAANFAVKEMQTTHEKLTLDRIVAAEQQVVAEMNYQIDLELTDRSSGEAVRREAEAVVYHDLDDNYSLTSWNWKK